MEKDFVWIDLSPSKDVNDFLEFQSYVKELVSSVYGIPSNLIQEKNEIGWQKIKRNARLWIFSLGLRIKKFKQRRKKEHEYYPSLSIEAIRWIKIYQEIHKFHLRKWRQTK